MNENKKNNLLCTARTIERYIYWYFYTRSHHSILNLKQYYYALLLLFCSANVFTDDTVFEGEGITVTASAPVKSSFSRTINRETIEQINAATVAELLEQAFGLSLFHTPDGDTVSMRGLGSGRIAVVVDGVSIALPLSGEYDLQSLAVDSIESIEVAEGGNGQISGAMGGVVSINTVRRSKKSFEGSVKFSNGSMIPGTFVDNNGIKQRPQWQDLFDSQRLQMHGGVGFSQVSFNGYIDASRTAHHLLFEDFTGTMRRSTNRERSAFGAGLSFVYDSPQYSTVKASSHVSTAQTNIPANRGGGFQTTLMNINTVSLEAPRFIRDTISANMIFNYTINQFNYTDISHHNSSEFSLKGQLKWFAANSVTASTDMYYHYTHIKSQEIGDKSGHNGNITVGAEYRFSDTTAFFPELNAIFRSKEFIPVPKFGIVWNINAASSLKATVYRIFNVPSFEDLYWNEAGFYGNPDLKSEDGWGTDFGIEYQESQFSVSGLLFATGISQAILWSHLSGAWKPRNIGEAALFGASLKLKKTFQSPLKAFNTVVTTFSYDYLLSYLLSDSLDFSDSIRMPYMPDHTFNVSIALTGSNHSFNIYGHFESSRFSETTNILKLEPYFLVNVNYIQDITKYITMVFKLNNIFNIRYFSLYDFPQPGFNIQIGVNVNF
ncbi:MAG: TonB-dependent receptor [Treponema sp.]|jgi:outer membrane cobalamin receptor|nr:TonB-dependent receptor [Treponema sp.]